MTTTTVDDRQRVQLPSAKPGQILAIQENPDGSITLCPVESDCKESSTLKVVKKNGHYILDQDMPREQIIAAIRADRDREGQR